MKLYTLIAKASFSLGIILFAFFLGIQTVHGQETAAASSNQFSLSGRLVEESTGAPIDNVIVKLQTQVDSVKVGQTLTDGDGKFVLNVKNPGKYQLRFSLIGYELKKTNVTLTAQKPTVDLGDLVLKSSAINLDEVKIEGNYKLKIDVDKKIYKIDANSLATNGSAGDILQNIPSVFVNPNGSVTLRGGKVRIYINGKPSGLLGISRSQILDYIPASLIESIEVINDPSAKYDSDGSSGIINIVLKNLNKPGMNGLITLSAGTTNRYNGSANFSYNYKKLNLFASYDAKSISLKSWETKNRFSNLVGPGKYVNQNRDFFSRMKNYNFRFRGEYAFSKKSVLGFSYLNSTTRDYDNNNFKYSQYDANYQLTNLYNRSIIERDRDHSNNVTLNYTKKFKNAQQLLSADMFYSNSVENTDGKINQVYYNLDGTPSTQLPLLANTFTRFKESNWVGQLDYDQPLTKKAKLEMGLKFRHRKNESSYLLENYYQPLDIYIPDNQISNAFQYTMNVNAGYVTFRHKIKSFSYKVGARVEQTVVDFNVTTGLTNHFNYTNLFPSVHLLQEFSHNRKLTFRYSRRIDRPLFSEINPLQQYNDPFFLNKGNPNLLPEFTDSYDVTYTKSWKQSSVSGSVYHRNSTSTIQRIVQMQSNGVTETSYQNLNRATNTGIELTAYVQLYKWWKINTSLNYYRNYVDGTAVGSLYTVDNYSYNAKLNQNFTPWKQSMIQISGIYQSPTYSPLVKNYGQTYMDASFKQDFLNRNLSLSIRCTDVFFTQRRYYDMVGDHFDVSSRFRRQSRVVYIGLVFRPFKQAKKMEDPNEEEEENTLDGKD